LEVSKLRLVKVAVQPFFVLDDGETITELDHPVAVIPANEWPTYSSERFPREVDVWQKQINAEAKPAPNRAARRARTKR
jgi:hypothetical protein